MTPSINQYIETRYNSWLDYSKYECKRAGIPDEAIDVLNEVIIQLSKKDENYLNRLLITPSKCKRYKELDVLVLRMIYLNIYSPTAPYQFKTKPIPRANKNLLKLNIEDVTEEESDIPALYLERFHQVQDAIESLNLSDLAIAVFDHKFTNGLPFCQWKGPETQKELYEIYNSVIEAIKDKIFNRTLF